MKIWKLLWPGLLFATSAPAASPAHCVAFFCGQGLEIHCAIPYVANRELSTRCWLLAGGQKALMQWIGPNRFIAGPIRMRLIDGYPMTAALLNLDTGDRVFCSP